MYGNIFDSHAHYDTEQFDIDRNSLLASLPEAGIVGIVNCGTDVKSSLKCLEFAERYSFIYAACGIHPEDVNEMKQSDYSEIEKMLSHEKCVALGEIGLDYHYDFVPRETQLTVFERQLETAVKHDIPVIVHDREAHADTLNLLKKYRPKGVMHCFSGSVETAKEILKLGMYIGLGGAVTFKNAVKPAEVAAMVPADRLLVETDCPYMAPVPMRGKRNNSAYISYVAEKLGEIRGCKPEEILSITCENAKRLFGIC
ncbi:MAG: TatD family hydrolase [Clostridiales bacterium]|nr:TatD family hydrolase [Clostridiales bacterium]